MCRRSSAGRMSRKGEWVMGAILDEWFVGTMIDVLSSSRG
jgi:hypothetical protein